VTKQISTLVDAAEERLADLERRANASYWDLQTTGDSSHGLRWEQVRLELADYLADAGRYHALAEAVGGPTGDSLLDRRVFLLYLAHLEYQAERDRQADIIRTETELEELFANFRGRIADRDVTDNEIRDILRESRDLSLRLDAWQGSKLIGIEAAPKILHLVRLRNDVAHGLGFRDYYAMQLRLQEIAEPELLQILGQLEELTDSPFAAMKAELDAEWAGRLGVAAPELRAHHYADPFFQEAPPAETAALDTLLKRVSIEDLSVRTFDSIGMDVRETLARSDLYERPGKNQHAFCTDMDRRGDVRVLCNLTAAGDEYWMSTMLHELGHAVYDQQIDPSLPWVLRRYAHVSTTEASAMFFGRLTADADWLHHIGGVPHAEAGRHARGLLAHLRRKMLIFVRWGLVMVRFERALYYDPEQDLNSLWWQLVERYQMIRPPSPRSTPDWAAKIHLAVAPVYYHNYLLGELTASHVGAAIAAATGTAEVVGNRALGDFWRTRIYRMGAARPWNDLVEQGTGERLNPRHFVEQFIGV
jgi:peptidyl-dipeptidase A